MKSKFSIELKYFLALSLLIILGFSGSFYEHVIVGPNRFSWHIVVHSFVMFGWLALTVVQTQLDAKANRNLHKKLGWASVFFVAVLLFPYSVRATLEMWWYFSSKFPDHVMDIAKFVYNPVLTLFGFMFLYTIAILKRKTREWHVVAMMGASIFLLSPGLERLPIYHLPFFKELGNSNFSNIIALIMLGVFFRLRLRPGVRPRPMIVTWLIVFAIYALRYTVQSNPKAIEKLAEILQKI
jgi:hypothetical protein